MDKPVAIVTGAGRGIGRAIALELAKRGYELALVARKQEELEETRKLAGGGMVIKTDVSRVDQIEEMAGKVIGRFGRVNALVNNAGLAPILKIEEMSADQWREIIDVNLSAAFYATRAVWETMKKQRGGVIVNISSVASRDPFPGFSAYGAAKAGLNLFGAAIAKEGKEHGIRMHTIAPGAVETSMFRAVFSAEKWPTEKTMSPEDVAKVVAGCVCGDLRHTSGEVIFLSK